MANSFIQKKEKQTYLIVALVIVILVTAIILWQGFFREKKPISLPSVIPEPVVLGYPEIRINFELLEKPEVKALIPFEEIPPFEGEGGRENPFLPY